VLAEAEVVVAGKRQQAHAPATPSDYSSSCGAPPAAPRAFS
jgi:hypothetical protein